MANEPLVRMPDLIVLGQEAWDEVERRNQLLVRALAERNPLTRFLFAEQPQRPRQVREWRLPAPRRVAERVWAITPVRPVPDRLSHTLADRIEAAQIRRAARRVGLERPMLWSQDPRTAFLIGHLSVSGLIYDLTDDWAAFEEDPVRRAEVQQRIDGLTRSARLVLACSRPLEEAARDKSDAVVYLPNAVEPPGPTGPVPADLAAIPRPRLGYAGTLHSSRIDVQLLIDAARRRPDWSFVFLGPNLLDPPESQSLLDIPNVVHLGLRPHDEVRSYLGGFDVCLLPNLVTEFTRSLDPLKLYEYLAAGRPIVATPVDNAPELAEHVAVAATGEELIDHSARAMARDDEYAQAARRSSVAGETWEARARAIEAALGIDGAPGPTDEVSVVIVSFNTRDLTDRCLGALYTNVERPLQVTVVDNGSTDGTQDLIRQRFPSVELLEAGRNLGFGPANNLAFPRCRGRFVLLLNSDAFLQPGALEALVKAAERHPRAAVLGPRLLNPDGSLQRSAWPFPSARRHAIEALGLHRLLRRQPWFEDLGTWGHDTEREVDFLVGACLLLRREALLDVGGFDEQFWLYAEEAGLQRRLTDRGWRVVLSPEAECIHEGGASSSASPARELQFHRGQMQYLRKHSGPVAAAMSLLALFVGSLMRGRSVGLRAAATLTIDTMRDIG